MIVILILIEKKFLIYWNVLIKFEVCVYKVNCFEIIFKYNDLIGWYCKDIRKYVNFKINNICKKLIKCRLILKLILFKFVYFEICFIICYVSYLI